MLLLLLRKYRVEIKMNFPIKFIETKTDYGKEEMRSAKFSSAKPQH